MNLSVTRLAQGIKVSEKDLDAIVHGINGITIDIALRLGHYFGMTPEFWINLQTRYDLDVAEHTVRRQIEREIESQTTPRRQLLRWSRLHLPHPRRCPPQNLARRTRDQ